MRIKHTSTEIYKIYNCFIMKGTYRNVKRWYYYKSYSTKQGAMKAIKRLKNEFSIEKNLAWKIDWFPSPYSSEYVTIYDESED